MSVKRTCDRCRIKDGTEYRKETPFRAICIDLCESCKKAVEEHIGKYLIHRHKMDEDFYCFLLNPQPGALEAIMGKFGYPESGA